MKFKPHSDKQEQAIFSNKKILAALTGIQFGKTSIGAVRMKLRMHQYTSPDDNFIIAAPNYKIMQQSTLPAFLKIMEGYGEYHRGDAVFQMHGGGKCWMRTSTEPDSIVGITDVRHIWVDEAGKVSLYFWENVVARSAFRDCQIDLTSSPYALNWLYKQIVQPKMRNKEALPHIDLIQAASWENPYMPLATIEHARLTMDKRRFDALFGGVWGRMSGLVYDCFDDFENQCEPFQLPIGTRYFGGIDWGYTEPFALTVRALTPNGKQYAISEFCKSGLIASEVTEVVKQKHSVFKFETVFCDPSQPAAIEALCRAGIPAVKADNDIRPGIDHHYELLKTRTLKHFKGMTPHALDEYETYHYPEPETDIGADDKVKEVLPVQRDDHNLDAHRYVSYGMKNFNVVKIRPRVPMGEEKKLDHWAETEKLKRKPKVYGQTENW